MHLALQAVAACSIAQHLRGVKMELAVVMVIGEESQLEWGMMTLLVSTARASWMIGIFRASHDDSLWEQAGTAAGCATVHCLKVSP
ncbi:hypothetical protein F7725_028601 [Dissostichus mawsoni]|uniref:Uncharacterized protein n=1 Tax=Dissostichus mawsoni TaxID=36200 RepID=A0A7J5XGS7_DISMA|nr:hypothetical protein F7725_028601 [Dissostichus mawsoni]